jgi:hypothetical protein
MSRGAPKTPSHAINASNGEARKSLGVHQVDIAAALQPCHSVRAVEMIDDQARVILVERIAGCDLAVSAPEAERGSLESREHHLFGAEPVSVGQE